MDHRLLWPWAAVADGRAKALVTSGVAWWLSIAQPTTRRENTSSTTQQYSLPSEWDAR
jgi:hypothetical protein